MRGDVAGGVGCFYKEVSHWHGRGDRCGPTGSHEKGNGFFDNLLLIWSSNFFLPRLILKVKLRQLMEIQF